MRFTLSALLLAATLGFAAADEPKTGDPAFAALKKAQTDLQMSFQKDMMAAKSNDDRKTVSEGYAPKRKKLADQAFALAKADTKAETAVDALLIAVQNDPANTEAVKFALDTFADDVRVLKLVPMLQYRPDGEKALKQLAASKNADVRAGVEFAGVSKAYNDLRNGFGKDMQAAKTDDEKKKLDAAFQPKHEKIAKQALDLAAAHPKAEFAVSALQLAMQDNTTDTEALRIVTDTLGDDPRVLGFVQMLQYRPDGEKALAKLADSKTRDVRGAVRFMQITAAIDRLDGKPADTQAEQDKAFAEQKAKLAAVAKEYADVKTAPYPQAPTVGDAAKDVAFMLDHLVVGKTLPDVDSRAVAGDKTVKISDYRGKVVVLDIWATWCGPCRAMIPHEKAMVEKLKDKPFALISASADEQKETLTDFLAKTDMPWTHWHAGPKAGIVEEYKVKFFPTIYVLDGKGVIRYKNIREKELETAVEKLLAEQEKSKS